MGTIDAYIGLLWGDDCECRLYSVEGNLLRVVVLLGSYILFDISKFGIYSS